VASALRLTPKTSALRLTPITLPLGAEVSNRPINSMPFAVPMSICEMNYEHCCLLELGADTYLPNLTASLDGYVAMTSQNCLGQARFISRPWHQLYWLSLFPVSSGKCQSSSSTGDDTASFHVPASPPVILAFDSVPHNVGTLLFILFIPCTLIWSHIFQTNKMHTSYLLYYYNIIFILFTIK
jgi:hypothetical protein